MPSIPQLPILDQSYIGTGKKLSQQNKSIKPGLQLFFRFLLCASIITTVLLAGSFYRPSSARNGGTPIMLNKIAGSSAVSAMSGSSFLVPEAVDTYASDCTTQDEDFVLGQTVCAVAVGAPPPFNGFRQRRFQWIAPSGFVVQQTNITTDPQSDTFTIPTSGPLAQVGTWTVRLIRNNGSTVLLTRFVVSDPANLRVDLSVSKQGPLQVTSGNNASYSIILINRGPDDAQSVQLTDTVPANMSFVSAVQTGGPAFDCTTPTAGGQGTISCTRALLAAETTATFTFSFEVTAGTPNGTTIDNTATVTSSTVELRPEDNSSTAPVTVTGASGGGTECVLTCPADVRVPHAPGEAGAIVTYEEPTASSASCGAISCSQASGTFFPVGTTPVVCLGETGDPCEFLVIVEDEVSPTISCPSDISVDEDPIGSGSAIVTYPPPTASDDSGTVNVTCDRPSGSSFPVGTTTVTCSATDLASNQATCSFTITVSGSSCTLTCPSNVVVNAPGNSCGAIVNYPAPTANACGTVTSTPASGSFFAAGVTTVTVTTGAGETCEFTVTVNANDQVAPTVVAPTPQTVVADEDCEASIPDYVNGLDASDNCTTSDSLTITQTPAGGTMVGAGTHNVAISVTDGSNNTTTVNTTFTVTDTTAPVITLNGPNPFTVECHTSFTDPGATANDSCAGSFAATASGIVDVNTLGTYTITYNASDPLGNAAASVTRMVVVVDTTAPVITLNGANPMTVECHTSFTDLGATASDDCAGPVLVTASGTVNADAPGSYTITYTATDGPNTTTVTRNVNVVDTTLPTITLNGSNPITAECHTSFTDPGATATDSCAGAVSVTASGSVNVNVPGSYTITYTATDGPNTATATRTVNVVDTTLPTITLTGAVINLWPPNHKYVTINLTQLVASASDSCDGSVDINDVVIFKVTSDELENSGGDGNTLNDIVIAANCKSVQLRAERDGGGNGRVYTIHFRVTDASGQVGTKTVQVKVPKSQGNGGGAIDSGVKYTVTCP